MSTEHEKGGGDLIDRDLVHRYRKASAELDERPSVSTRAAILAAAAREVQAKPVVAGAAHRRRPSWPLAAAAAVMLSTLAVMLAIRTQEEMPQFSAADSTGSAAEKVVAPVVPTPVPEASSIPEEARAKQSAPAQDLARNAESQPPATRDAASNSQRVRESDQAGTAPSKPKQAAAVPAPSERRQSANAPTPGAAPVNDAPAAPPPAAPALPKTQPADAAPPPAAEAPVAGAALKKAQSEANAGLAASRQDQAAPATSTPDARTDALKPFAPAPSVTQQRQRAEGAASESATAWLERIIRLRREGRHSEADAELKLFRERYPQVQPPSEALSPSPAK